jgi:hypothetical protein
VHARGVKSQAGAVFVFDNTTDHANVVLLLICLHLCGVWGWRYTFVQAVRYYRGRRNGR